MSTEPTTSLPSLYIGLFLLQWAFNLGIAAWMYFRNADNKNEAATKAIGEKLDGYIAQQNERMAGLEATIEHLPTDQEMSRLRADVAEMKGRVEGIDDLLKRVDRQLTIVHEHLLRK